MTEPDDFDRWKREVWEAMSVEERNQILEAQREHKRRERHRKYLEYLESDQWKLIRRLKIEEARGMCEVCSSRDNLQCHHRSYARLFQERLEDLTVLCDACHELYEKNKRLRSLSA